MYAVGLYLSIVEDKKVFPMIADLDETIHQNISEKISNRLKWEKPQKIIQKKYIDIVQYIRLDKYVPISIKL